VILGCSERWEIVRQNGKGQKKWKNRVYYRGRNMGKMERSEKCG
jgi:hypothetical protein